MKALDFIHSKGFTHRTIRASRIFIGDNGEVKLSGLENGTIGASERRIYPEPYWLSPEIILEESSSCKMDIWSLGITILELVFGYPPFYDLSPLRTLFLIPQKDPPRLIGNSFSDEFKEFLTSCLTKDWKERPTAKQLLNHPFILNAKVDTSCIKSLLNFHTEFKRSVMYLERYDGYYEPDDFDYSDEEN